MVLKFKTWPTSGIKVIRYFAADKVLGIGDDMREGDRPPPFRVLFVDDNQDAADSATILLQLVGFAALACYDGDSALELNQTFQPEICFIDLHMPGMDGDELVLRIRSGSGWRPSLLVALTAMSDERSQTRIKVAGFDLHLIKPVDPQKLLGVTDALFRMSNTGTRTSPDQRHGDNLGKS